MISLPKAVAGDGVGLPTERLLALRHAVRRSAVAPRAVTALPGGLVVRRRGRGLEVDDIRAYAAGDDIRHLDRNTSARTGVPHIRLFRDERERTLILLVDLRASMLWGTRRAFRSVVAAEAAALAGWRAVDAGSRVGLVAFGANEPVVVAARGRERGMIAVCGGLALAYAEAMRKAESGAATSPRLELVPALDLLSRLAPRGASILMATGLDDPGDGFDAAAGALCRRVDVGAALVIDAFEREASSALYPFVAGGGVRLGRIAAGFDLASDARIQRLTALRIGVAPVLATDSPEDVLASLERLDGERS